MTKQTETTLNITPRASDEECKMARGMLSALKRTMGWGTFLDQMQMSLNRGCIISKKQFDAIKRSHEMNCKKGAQPCQKQ